MTSAPSLLPKPLTAPARAGNGRGGTALRCLGAVTVSTTKRVDKKGYCGQGGAGYPISITICLLCHGCFGVSKFCIDRLSCKCISVLVITWPYLTKYFWKHTYLKYLASSALLVKQQSSWLEYCHPPTEEGFHRICMFSVSLWSFDVLGIIFFQEIRMNIKYGGSQRTQHTAHVLVGRIYSF